MSAVRIIAIVACPLSALAQPVLTPTQILNGRHPAVGAPALTGTPSLDVSPDGTVVLADSQIFARNVYLSSPGQPFTRFAQLGFAADLPDGSRLGVNFRGAWAGPGPAVFGNDGEIGLVGSVVGQTLAPHYWQRQALPHLGPGVRFASGRFDRVAITDTGRSVAAGVVEGPGITSANRAVLVESAPAGPRVLFQSGSDPLARPGVAFSIDNFACEHAANNTGQTVFSALHYRAGTLAGPAVLFHDGERTRIIIDADLNPPGFGLATRLQQVSIPFGINSSGDVAFVGRVSSAPKQPGCVGIFKTVNGELALAFRSGDPIPALGPGVTGNLNGDVFAQICPLNDFGDVAFVVRLSGPGVSAATDSAICMLRDGEIHVVAREGTPVPGAIESPAPTIGELHLSIDSALYMNARRQTVVISPHTGARQGLRAVLCWSPSRGLQSLAFAGMPVPFEDQFRPVSSITIPTIEQRGNYWLRSAGGNDGRRTLLDDTGSACFWANLTGGDAALYRTTLLAECVADFNDDGFIDFADYVGFTEAFETAGSGADANNDGFLDFFDYGRFVEVFERGC